MRANRIAGVLCVSLTLVSLLRVPSAFAQTDSSAREQADALFEHGKAALKADDWQTACADFQRSRELDESASTVVKIARCREHDGHLLQARAEYARALVLIRARPASDTHARDLESLVQSSLAAVEARLALTPTSPAKETLVVGHETSAPAPSVPRVTNPTRSLPQPTVQKAPATAVPAVTQSPVRPAERHAASPANTGKAQRVVGYVTASAGVVLAVVAGYFGVRTQSYVNDARADNHCDGNYRCDGRGLELINTAREQQTNAIIAGVGSSFLIGAGIVLIATAPSKRVAAMGAEKRLAVAVSPLGAAVGGQW